MSIYCTLIFVLKTNFYRDADPYQLDPDPRFQDDPNLVRRRHPCLWELSVTKVRYRFMIVRTFVGSVGKERSSLSLATKDAERQMGKVDIGGCRIELDDIRYRYLLKLFFKYRRLNFCPKFHRTLNID